MPDDAAGIRAQIAKLEKLNDDGTPKASPGAEWTEDGLIRLLAAIKDPITFERREAFRHMNDVLAAHKAGRATYEQYAEAFAEFEQIARETGEMA